MREALIALEVEGWVEVRTGSGVYVLDRSSQASHAAARSPQIPADEWGPLELTRARRAVEGETAAMAATEARPGHIAAMAQALARMQGDADQDVLPLDGDRDFRTAIAEACGNVVLIKTVQRFWDSRCGPLFKRLTGYFETFDSWRAAIAEHKVILLAIRSRDSAAARLAMHQHMDNSHTRFSVSWRQSQKPREPV